MRSRFPGIVVGFLFSLFTEPGWLSSLLGIAAWRRSPAARSPKPITASAHEEGLGMGDVKMLAMIGAFLGWQLTLVTLMLASFAGSIVGVRSDRHAARRHEVRAAVRHVSAPSARRWRRPSVTALLDWYLRFWS